MLEFVSKLFIPHQIGESERLVRFLLSPMHFNSKTGELRPNAYNPSKGTSEVSMTRLDYSTEDKCKRLGKKIAINASKNNRSKEFKGFGLITKGVALNCGATNVVRDPICGNRAHAELLLPGTKEDKAIAAELQYVQDQLVSKTKVFIDNNTNSRNWEDAPLIY